MGMQYCLLLPVKVDVYYKLGLYQMAILPKERPSGFIINIQKNNWLLKVKIWLGYDANIITQMIFDVVGLPILTHSVIVH